MAAVAPRYTGFVCQLCRAERRSLKRVAIIAHQPMRGLVTKPLKPLPTTAAKPASKAASPVVTHTPRPKPRPKLDPRPNPKTPRVPLNILVQPQCSPGVEPKPRPRPKDILVPTFTVASLIDEAAKITASNDKVADELDVLELLERCHTYANFIIFGQAEISGTSAEAVQNREITATSSLLELADESQTTIVQTPAPANLPELSSEKAAESISQLTYDVLRAKHVFITPSMLDIYVRIHCLLGSPQFLPAIFYLYANKPVPKAKTSPIVYTAPWPKSPTNAIPMTLADAALEAAIAKKDLALAIAVVDTTVALPAFRRSKLLRKASLPFVGLACLPVAVWAAATKWAHYQVTWDIPMFKFIVVAASTAYFGTLGTVGFVALMTYNDHFQRVVWHPGLNLRDRWMREEERLYFDRIALAWGFPEKWRRGEEEGEEWEALREFIGVRAMILDKSDLLEGME